MPSYSWSTPAQYIHHQPDTMPLAKKELHYILEDKDTAGIPLLILANKIDINPHMEDKDIVLALNLDYIADNEWALVTISSLYGDRLQNAIEWLLKIGKDKKAK